MAIQRALLERLRNPDPPGERRLHASTGEVFDSILANLRDILNTNEGNCLIDEQYGLPHMASVRLGIPWTIASFANAIRTTIERHEPRLSNVRVRHAPGTDRTSSLRFEISGVIQDEDGRTNVRFETCADEEGRMRVK